MSPRREYYSSPQCAHDGCTERAHCVFATRKEQREAWQRQQEAPWRCARHRRPTEVLSADAPVCEHALVLVERTYESRNWQTGEVEAKPLGLFWAPEGSEKGGSGFTYGPGFRAFAEDFPAGTRLVVTARIELPA
jgi:hypothetical protein